MTKKKNDVSGAALATGGGVAAGTGLVVGGIPKAKSDFTTVLNPAVSRSRGGGKHKGAEGPGTSAAGTRKGDSRLKARSKLPKAAPGGVLGFRIHAHEGGTAGYMQDAAEHAKTTAKNPVDTFYRGYNKGKIEPELKIIRGMTRGRTAAHGLAAAGVGTAAYGLDRHNDERKLKLKRKVSKRDDKRTEKYHGALAGGGATVAAGSHFGAKYMDKNKKKYADRASRNVDEAGKLIPSLAGREKKNLPKRKVFNLIREGKPHPMGMYPKVKDGDIARNPKLLEGATPSAIDRAGALRGAATQERHFAEVFGDTAKVVRRGRAPGAIVAGAGLGGLATQYQVKPRDKVKIKKSKPLMSDAELRRRKKLQGKISQTTSTLGLAGVTTGIAAIAASKGKGAPGRLKALQKVPGLKNTTADKLKDAGLYTSLASGGIGGVGGYNFAAYTNAESRKRTMLQPKKKIQKSLGASAFGVVHD